jgi:hypothetical protein
MKDITNKLCKKMLMAGKMSSTGYLAKREEVRNAGTPIALSTSQQFNSLEMGRLALHDVQYSLTASAAPDP